NNIRNTVNNQVQQNLKNSPYNQANMQQWHQNMHAQGAAETQHRIQQQASAAGAEAERRKIAGQQPADPQKEPEPYTYTDPRYLANNALSDCLSSGENAFKCLTLYGKDPHARYGHGEWVVVKPKRTAAELKEITALADELDVDEDWGTHSLTLESTASTPPTHTPTPSSQATSPDLDPFDLDEDWGDEGDQQTGSLSELRKDTEPLSFCKVGSCLDEIELNYDGQLLASVGIDDALISSAISGHPVARTVAALTTAGMAAWQWAREKGTIPDEESVTRSYSYHGNGKVTDMSGEPLPYIAAKGRVDGLGACRT
ncbi:MAG: hypothetical protein ACR2PX_03630, partial [Endozoicomonas sp.]|uniref:hypothetical protein n=1 Tax=Endozoicomonas sp. TaxID=1892382 RepID=UPI003D9ABFC4